MPIYISQYGDVGKFPPIYISNICS